MLPYRGVLIADIRALIKDLTGQDYDICLSRLDVLSLRELKRLFKSLKKLQTERATGSG